MGTFWNEERIKSYENAANFLHYPEVPLKEYFEKMIRPEDTVLEIGSGPGVVSTYLAKLCQKLIAIEEDDIACEHIKERAKEQGLTNIEVVNGTWPNIERKAADVSVTLYVYKAFQTFDLVKELLACTHREGMIMITQPGTKGGFMDPLRKRLGLEVPKPSCYNDGCRTAALLEAAGATVHCETIHHEFGQPVDTLDEAAQFMVRHLKLDEDDYPKVREVAVELTEKRKSRWYVPIYRNNCLVMFKK